MRWVSISTAASWVASNWAKPWAMDFAWIAVVELERSLHSAADEQRLHDGGLDAALLNGNRQADLLGRQQHKCFPLANALVGGARADGDARRVVGLLVARVAEHVLAVGEGDRDGRGVRQQKLAHLLGGLLGKPVAHGVDHGGGQLQHGIGLQGAHGIGIHHEPNDHDDGNGEHGPGRNEHRDRERRLRERPHERDARQGGNGGRQHFLVELGHPDAPRGNRARFALRHNRTP